MAWISEPSACGDPARTRRPSSNRESRGASMGTEVAGAPDTLGERKLTTLHAIGQSLALGPMFSVGIVLGSVSTGAHWNATLSVLIAGLGVLAIGFAVTVFARRYAGAG